MLWSVSYGPGICAAISILVLLGSAEWSVLWSPRVIPGCIVVSVMVSFLAVMCSEPQSLSCHAVVIVLTSLWTVTWPCYGQNYGQSHHDQDHTQCPDCAVVSFKVSTIISAELSTGVPSSMVSVVVRIVDHHWREISFSRTLCSETDGPGDSGSGTGQRLLSTMYGGRAEEHWVPANSHQLTIGFS